MGTAFQIDPEVAAVIEGSPITAMRWDTLGLDGVPSLREAMDNAPRPPIPPTEVTHEDRPVPGPAGAPDVLVRIHRPPNGTAPMPCIYWIHGGGYLFGSALVEDARLNRWAEQFGCVVVSVEYRLAPEHPYPAPLDDCYAGLAWTAGAADELGIDLSRLVIGGASAGGGLAAGLALLVRDRGEIPVAAQLLIYPMIDDRNTSASSRLDTVVWTRDANLLGWRAYLGRPPGGDDVPQYAAAARADDLARLPPAWIGVGTLDVFRDEDIQYAARLLAAGVETELHVYPGAPHGFEVFAPTAAVSRRCRRDMDAWLGQALVSQVASTSG